LALAPDPRGPWDVDLIVGGVRREELGPEPFCPLDGLARIRPHVAPRIAVAMNHADERGARVAAILLHLMDDAGGYVGKVSSELRTSPIRLPCIFATTDADWG